MTTASAAAERHTTLLGNPTRSIAVIQATRYRFADVGGRKIFYREAGNRSQPTIILLHGFPSSSFMFRNLIPLLADRFHVIAPDYIGFGESDAPSATAFDYTFDNLAAYVEDSSTSSGSNHTSCTCRITVARWVSVSSPGGRPR